MSEFSINNSCNNVSQMRDGLRYRRKRKHHELSRSYEDELGSIAEEKKDGLSNQEVKKAEPSRNEEKSVKANESKGKQFKFHVNKEIIGVNSKSNNNIQNKENNIPVNSAQQNNNIQKNLPKCNKEDKDLTVITEITEVCPQLNTSECEGKKMYLRELEKVRMNIKKYEESYKKTFLKLIVHGIQKCCERNTRNVKNFKVFSLFKNDKFSVNLESYLKQTLLINLELLSVDLIMNSKHQYQSLIDVDCPNMGNIILCYFSQIVAQKIIKSILTQIENSIERYSENKVFLTRDWENIKNSNKNKGVLKLYDLYKENYQKFRKVNILNNKKTLQMSINLDNVVYSEIFNNYAKEIDLKNLPILDFNSVSPMLHNTPSTVDVQIRKSRLALNNVKYTNEEMIEESKKKIKLKSTKEEIKINHQDFLKSIINLEVYYLNSSDLARDFLNAY